MTKIDLNSDLGEGFGLWSLGDDDVLTRAGAGAGAGAGATVLPLAP